MEINRNIEKYLVDKLTEITLTTLITHDNNIPPFITTIIKAEES